MTDEEKKMAIDAALLLVRSGLGDELVTAFNQASGGDQVKQLVVVAMLKALVDAAMEVQSPRTAEMVTVLAGGLMQEMRDHQIVKRGEELKPRKETIQ